MQACLYLLWRLCSLVGCGQPPPYLWVTSQVVSGRSINKFIYIIDLYLALHGQWSCEEGSQTLPECDTYFYPHWWSWHSCPGESAPPELHLMLGSNNFLMLYHISYIGIALKIVNELKQKCFNSKKTAEGFMAEFYREVYYSYKK